MLFNILYSVVLIISTFLRNFHLQIFSLNHIKVKLRLDLTHYGANLQIYCKKRPPYKRMSVICQRRCRKSLLNVGGAVRLYV